MTLNEYFDRILNDKRFTVDHQELVNQFNNDKEKGNEDILLWTVYHLNQRTNNIKHVARSILFLQTLSFELLQANAYATDECQDEKRLEPIYDDYKNHLSELPDTLYEHGFKLSELERITISM